MRVHLPSGNGFFLVLQNVMILFNSMAMEMETCAFQSVYLGYYFFRSLFKKQEKSDFPLGTSCQKK